MTIETITTERLVLRSTRKSDLDSLYKMVFSVPEVMSHAFGGEPYAADSAADFFENCFDHDGNGKQLGVLCNKDSDIVVGFAGLLECQVLGEPDYEIGFVLGREFWGQGYATEIGRAQIEYGLGVIGCKRLLAQVAPTNQSSISVLRKIGMVYHATVDSEFRGMREIYITQGPE
jgi:RimJ/RimL family protein N-acetyltransferase